MSKRWVTIGSNMLEDQMPKFHERCKNFLRMKVDKDSLHRPQIVSKTSFCELTQTRIAFSYLFKPTVGKYLLLRVVEEGYTRADCSWFCVVDDQTGDAIGLALYNYPLDLVFPKGTIFVIKEPYLMIKMGLLFIRCDCLTDIIVLSPSNPYYQKVKQITWKDPIVFEEPLAFYPIPSSPEEWIVRGNKLFLENKMFLAREAYSVGFRACSEFDPNARPIFLNLLKVNLNLDFWEWVIEHAKKVPDEEEALFLMGKAYYMLRRYKNARTTFRDLMKRFFVKGMLGEVSAFQDAIELLKVGKLELLKEYKNEVDKTWNMFERAETRMKEKRGTFRIEDLINESKKNPVQEIDCADFCVFMEITDILDKGRGLILGKEVKKDQDLIISKAWATAFRNERNVEKDATEMKNLKKKWKVDDDGMRAKVVSKLTNLVFKNPKNLESKLFKLHAGESNSGLVQLFSDPWTKMERICDVNRINDIFVSNGFTMRHAESKAITGSGLFYLPSFLNHSCEPNVDCKFYNDVMVVTALEDIAAGTELTITYVSLDLNYKDRTDRLKERGFVCTCPKCVKKI